MDVDEVRRRIWSAGGVATWTELGVDQRSMDRALTSGRVVRLARGTYALSSRRASRRARPRPANPFESALHGIALDAGVTGLEPQVEVVLPSCTVRPDLVDHRRRMVAEADSFTWHGDRRALAADCRRYDDLVATGWTVLRFAWEQVMFDQDWVAGTLRDTAERCCGYTGVQKSA